MIVEIKYKNADFQNCVEELMEKWSDISNKVFVLRADKSPDVKNFILKF